MKFDRAFVTLSILALAAIGRPAQFVGLGDLAGGEFSSRAMGISRDGLVVVGTGKIASGDMGFTWKANTGLVAIGDLPGGFTASTASGTSNSGAYIVGSSHSANGLEAYVQFDNNPLQGLGDIAGGAFSSTATAVSNLGTAICGTGTHATGSVAWYRLGSNPIVSLGDLAGGPFDSDATNISGNGGVVVGAASVTSLGDSAFKWKQSTGMVALPHPLGADSSRARGVDYDGDVIVGDSRIGLQIHPVMWKNGVPELLGDLPGGSNNGIAWCVDDSGRFVAGYASSWDGDEAFLWDAVNGMRRLEDILNQNGIATTGWVLRSVYDLTVANGQIHLVGVATDPNGNQQAYIARIPMIPLQEFNLHVDFPNITLLFGPTVQVQIRQNGNTLMTFDAQLDLAGNFQMQSELPVGWYDVHVNPNSHYLKQTAFSAFFNEVGCDVNMTLVNGDVVRDNAVDSDDFDALVDQFGTGKEYSGDDWIGSADLNEDNLVDSDDFDILVQNFGATGNE